MTSREYLLDWIRRREKLPPEEVEEIRAKRLEVEDLVRNHFESKVASFVYSGSIAKGTAIKSSADLDLAVYFHHDEFETLREMYNAVESLLSAHYKVRPQRVSIGLPDLHVDVVPGRKISNEGNLVNLYRTDTGTSIQTSIQIHKEFVSQSSARDEIRLTKIWRTRWALNFKSFAIELLVIKALEGQQATSLPERMGEVLTFISQNVESIRLIDPANSNNDVAETVNQQDKVLMRQTAELSLELLTAAAEGDEADQVRAWRQVFRDDLEGEWQASQPPVFGRTARRRDTEDWREQPSRRHG